MEELPPPILLAPSNRSFLSNKLARCGTVVRLGYAKKGSRKRVLARRFTLSQNGYGAQYVASI